MSNEKKISSQVSFNKKEDKGNHVAFKLLSIKILEEYIPKNVNSLLITNEEVIWDITYYIEIKPHENKMKRISAMMGMSLSYLNDPDKKSIIKLKSITEFEATADINESTKFDTLEMLFNIANWNLQGVYISKIEDSPLTMIAPPELNVMEHEKYFKQQIANEWI